VTHDPECPQGSRLTKWGPRMCVCHIIARTRAQMNGIMSHDPLCPRYHTTEIDLNGLSGLSKRRRRQLESIVFRCDCDLIAKVRADEREKAAQRIRSIDQESYDCTCMSAPNPMRLACIASARGEAS
jgi:hypothetical protein